MRLGHFQPQHKEQAMTPTDKSTITIPAYAADTLGETLTLHAPFQWHERIANLSPYCCYGPNYRRRVKDTLQDMSDTLQSGYSALAYDHLLTAEQFAGIVPGGAA